MLPRKRQFFALAGMLQVDTQGNTKYGIQVIFMRFIHISTAIARYPVQRKICLFSLLSPFLHAMLPATDPPTPAEKTRLSDPLFTCTNHNRMNMSSSPSPTIMPLQCEIITVTTVGCLPYVCVAPSALPLVSDDDMPPPAYVCRVLHARKPSRTYRDLGVDIVREDRPEVSVDVVAPEHILEE